MINEDIMLYLAKGESIFEDIYPLFCGKEDCTPEESFGPAVREYYLLHICSKGKGIFYSNNEPFIVEEGQCFLIYPQELTFYQADEKEPWSYVWIAMEGKRIEKYLEMIGLSKTNPVCACPDVRRIVSYVDDIFEHNTLDAENEFYIQSVLMKILAELIKRLDCPQKSKTRNSNFYISKAIAYINLHYHEQITVKEIADFLALNRSYLTDVFLKTVHMAPQKFIMNFRVTKAAEFLVSTDISVENIAYSCGYANLASFSKAFKKVLGCSPANYRKNKKTELLTDK